MLLVDARNAVNHLAALWNARILWPRCSRFCLIFTMDMLDCSFKVLTSTA